MRCPSCGASQNDSSTCEECGNSLVDTMTTSEVEPTDNCSNELTESPANQSSKTETRTQSSRLIEFPGVSRSTVPEWRKEIAERVREAQERRAREAAAEAQLKLAEQAERGIPQLELLPQADVPPMNPLVAAALKRIERAHSGPASRSHAGRSSRMAAVAYAESAFPSLAPEPVEPPMTIPPTLFISPPESEPTQLVEEPPPEVEKTHNLVVVPPPTPKPEIELEVEKLPASSPKPRRVISDDINSPALNYLDSVSTTIHAHDFTNNASAVRRFFAGIVDLIILSLLFAPVVGVIEYTQGNWRDAQTIAFAALSLLVLSFLYSTVCTALTGRTLGMRLLNLRVIDSRTGLIPTGKQSAGRAVIFNLSLLTAGIVLALALVDPDRRAPHDRFTQTAVVNG